MFKQNKYCKWYFSIIKKAKSRIISGYTEKHHIIPKSLGGKDTDDNLVILTAREHFICHLLLIKMVDTTFKYKMVYAAWQQSRPNKNKSIKVTSRVYDKLRKQLSESYIGRKRAPFTDEAKRNMKNAAQNRKKVVYTEQRIQHIKQLGKRDKNGDKNPFFGKTHSDEFRKRKAEHNRSRPKVFCSHCRQYFDVGMANRWHLDKCKLISQGNTGDSTFQS